MFISGEHRYKRTAYIVFGVMLTLIICVYANTFESSWHLDDYPNIVENSGLHITDLSPQSLHKAFFSHPARPGRVYRPVACLTFALNWYLGRDNVFGYHIVNLSIHILTALILYCTILVLYRSPNLKYRRPNGPEIVALLAASLWAVNPVQTQAVTYIVQRMAAMAALFYILGIFFYVKARLSEVSKHRILLFTGCAVSYGLAFGSKENAVILPTALVLVEVVFFQNLSDSKTIKRLGVCAAVVGILLIVAGIFFFVNMDNLSILKGYRQRSFDLSQRLMTQPGIVIFYLSQLFYPVPQRLSIEHNIDVAISFFEPWYTLPAMFLILVLIGIGLSQIKKRPVIACGILFYFLNHLVESTVLPLELVFEHRNYLPSLFLFWPVAAGAIWAIDYYRKKRRSIAISLTAFLVLCILGLGTSTYIRNMDWATDRTLWEDAVQKAPGRTRPVYNLAKYYFKAGDSGRALALFQKSLETQASKPAYSRALSLNGIAGIYFARRDYEKVIELCSQALEISPGFESARYNSVLAHIKLDQWEEASTAVDLLLAKHRHRAGYRLIKGFILLKQNRPDRALPYLREAMKIKPGDRKIMLNTGTAMSLIGQHKQAEWFFRRVLDQSPSDILTCFYLVENSVKAGDSKMLARYLDRLTASFKIDTIKSGLSGRWHELFLISPSWGLIGPVVKSKLTEVADEISGRGSW
jgi:tetratricopeptide (TPR) repeat protein